jgi:hypothetical protein
MPKIQIIPPSPAAGEHVAKLRPIVAGQGTYGPTFRFDFEVVDGDSDGCVISRTTGQNPKRGESLIELLDQLYGRKLAANETVDSDELVGRSFVITVVPTGSGVALQSVTPVDK